MTAMLIPGTDNFCMSAVSVRPASSPSRPVCGPSMAAINASGGDCAVAGASASTTAMMSVENVRMLLLPQFHPMCQRIADSFRRQRHRRDAANQYAAAQLQRQAQRMRRTACVLGADLAHHRARQVAVAQRDAVEQCLQLSPKTRMHVAVFLDLEPQAQRH